jgi:predicted acyl esterase
VANPDVLSQPQYEPVFEQNIEMPMRDGTILRANVTRPNADPVGALALQ